MIAGSDEVYLRGVTAFRDHLVIEERVDGLDQVRLRGYDGSEHRIPFPEASYAAGLGGNPEFAPAAYRLGYSLDGHARRRSTTITRPSAGSRC